MKQVDFWIISKKWKILPAEDNWDPMSLKSLVFKMVLLNGFQLVHSYISGPKYNADIKIMKYLIHIPHDRGALFCDANVEAFRYLTLEKRWRSVYFQKTWFPDSANWLIIKFSSCIFVP